jgi:hypothetical protein
MLIEQIGCAFVLLILSFSQANLTGHSLGECSTSTCVVTTIER